MNKWLVSIIALIIILAIAFGIYWFFYRDNSQEDAAPTPTVTVTPSTESAKPKATETTPPTKFENIKTPHFVSSSPANNQVLTTLPSKVTITFNFDLGPASEILVMANGNILNTSEPTKISSDNLSMSQTINPVEGASYKVTYIACWPDGSCHNGSFGFTAKSNE